MDETIPILIVQTPCITLLAFDGLLQVLCEVSGDGHSEVGSGFSESGSTEINRDKYQSGKIKSFVEITSTLYLTLKELLKLLLETTEYVKCHTRSSAYWPSVISVKEGTLSCNWEMRFEWDGDWTWDGEHGLQGDSPPTDEADPNTILEWLQITMGELVRFMYLQHSKSTHHCPCLSYDHWEVKLSDNFVLSLVPQRLMQSCKRSTF